MTTETTKTTIMRISLPHLLPLILLLFVLLLLALQPARAAETVPPCKANTVTLFGDERRAYAQEYKGRIGELQEERVAYQQSADQYADQLQQEGAGYMANHKAWAEAYKKQGQQHLAAHNNMKARLAEDAIKHQQQMNESFDQYMAEGCDLTQWIDPASRTNE
ncbi:MAG: hypothetical protein NDJ24_03680 [Alphaproteobacteria bacterium]|nr:hypothetical protein [Alphaproteobacteria bacterium]